MVAVQLMSDVFMLRVYNASFMFLFILISVREFEYFVSDAFRYKNQSQNFRRRSIAVKLACGEHRHQISYRYVVYFQNVQFERSFKINQEAAILRL